MSFPVCNFSSASLFSSISLKMQNNHQDRTKFLSLFKSQCNENTIMKSHGSYAPEFSVGPNIPLTCCQKVFQIKCLFPALCV